MYYNLDKIHHFRMTVKKEDLLKHRVLLSVSCMHGHVVLAQKRNGLCVKYSMVLGTEISRYPLLVNAKIDHLFILCTLQDNTDTKELLHHANVDFKQLCEYVMKVASWCTRLPRLRLVVSVTKAIFV